MENFSLGHKMSEWMEYIFREISVSGVRKPGFPRCK